MPVFRGFVAGSNISTALPVMARMALPRLIVPYAGCAESRLLLTSPVGSLPASLPPATLVLPDHRAAETGEETTESEPLQRQISR